MKQKDIALYVVIAIFSTVLSVIVSTYLITPNKIKKQKSEEIKIISSEFNKPKSDDKYFNKNANNPTKLITIGDEPGKDPFSSTGN